MNGPIGVNAERGSQRLLADAGHALRHAISNRGAKAGITCLNTVYYLPVSLSMLARPVQALADLQNILQQAGSMPETGRATLLAAEVLEALRAADGHFVSPVSDAQIHYWGIRLADGRIPAIALILGHATSPGAARELIQELRLHNVLCLLGSDVWAQLKDSGFAPVDSNYMVALGPHSSSAVHALGVAARCAMKLGGHKPGSSAEMLEYCRRRMPGLVLALGGMNEQDYAIAQGAEEFGFPLIESQGGAENARDLVEHCIAARGLKPKAFNTPIPVSYGPAFEDETISDDDLHVQFGGPGCEAFLLLQTASTADVTDGRIELVGPALPNRAQRASMQLGIVVRVSGEKLQSDFESYLERQIPAFISYASGIQCAASEQSLSLRVSKQAMSKGFGLESLGQVIHARLHAEFGSAIEKAEVLLITEEAPHAAWLEKSLSAHRARKQRLDALRDDQVDAFYACTNCSPIAPRTVSIISPERVSPCGRCDWLDARASYELNAAGARRPIPLGKPIDIEKGIWEGTNQYARVASQGRIQQVALYSIIETPMAACADFECIVVLIPEANGVMVLSRDDTTMGTPAGLTVETFASLAAGEQIPGIVAMGRSHLLGRRFIAPEGGFKRVVWMSSSLKAALGDELQAVCTREGEPDLMEKIADEKQATTVEQLVQWLKQHNHPALTMKKMF